MTDVLAIAGVAGVGKSSVAFEVSLQLQRARVDHALIDTDELDRIYPVRGDLPALTERNLAAVWGRFAERGARRLILVGVHIVQQAELDWISRAVPDASFTLVRLHASLPTLRARIDRREVGTGAAAQWERSSLQLATAALDEPASVHVLETDDVSVEELADEILGLWPRSADDASSGRRFGNC